MYDEVIDTLLHRKAMRAVKYISPNQIVRATRTKFRGKFLRGNIEITVTIGKPNFLERKFIRDCKDAGEPFPVKKIQLKSLPEVRKVVKNRKDK